MPAHSASSVQAERRESELALWLENASPDDPAVLEALGQTYAGDLERLITILFETGGRATPETEVTHKIIARTFAAALAGLRQFRGSESVRSWIFSLGIDRAMRAWRRGRKPRRQRGAQTPLAGDNEARAWQIIDVLDGKVRLALALRYIYDLSVTEIASILKARPEEVHGYLAEGREIIQLATSDEDAPPPRLDRKHLKIRKQIQASLDGLPPVDLQARSALEEHLQSCQSCQNYVEELQGIEKLLRATLSSRWGRQTMPAAQYRKIIESVHTIKSRPRTSLNLAPRLKEALWMGSVLVGILVLFWYLQKSEIPKETPQITATPAPTPTALEMRPASQRDISGQDQASAETLIYYATPLISNDGRWAVYTEGAATQNDSGSEVDWQAMLYDRQTGKKRILSPSGEHWPGNKPRFNHATGMSQDGRWIVYTSNFHSPGANSIEECLEGKIPGNCLDVYLMDRIRDRLLRISETELGQAANGPSGIPTISPDGRWITFWSAATNLVPAEEGYCESPDRGAGLTPLLCVDLFVYDRINRSAKRIPIGRRVAADRALGISPVPISADGQWLAITLKSTDQAASALSMSNEQDVFLYHRYSQVFLAVNRAMDAAPGNGLSMSPALSSDGRYLAFASLASNLVPGDDNRQADVFRYDSWANTIELVSIAADGSQGNGASGSFVDIGIDSNDNLKISANGRYILFGSRADNLAEKKGICPSADWYLCSIAYLRDMKDQTTELVYSGVSSNSAILMPMISPDGRWTLAVSSYLECPYTPVCSEILLHDRNIGLTSTLIHGEFVTDQAAVAGWRAETLFGEPTSGVKSVAFSPDSQFLASGSYDSTVRLWKVSDGSLLKTFTDHNMPVTAVAFSPDGALLVSGSYDGTIKLFDVVHQQFLQSISGDGGAILSLAFSPDGNLLAVGGSGQAWVWEIQPDILLLKDKPLFPGLLVYSVAFSPDNRLLALGLSDGTIWANPLHPAEGKGKSLRLGGQDGKVFSLNFSPDGNYLASGAEDGSVNLWKIAWDSQDQLNAGLVYSLRHDDWVNEVAFSPDGAQLAVVSLGSGLRFWDLASGSLLSTEPEDPYFQALSVAIAPDGNVIAVGSVWGNIRLLKKDVIIHP